MTSVDDDVEAQIEDLVRQASAVSLAAVQVADELDRSIALLRGQLGKGATDGQG